MNFKVVALKMVRVDTNQGLDIEIKYNKYQKW